MRFNRRDLLKRCLGALAAVPLAGRLVPKSEPIPADRIDAHPLLSGPERYIEMEWKTPQGVFLRKVLVTASPGRTLFQTDAVTVTESL